MTDLLAISGERFEYETRMLIEAQKRGGRFSRNRSPPSILKKMPLLIFGSWQTPSLSIASFEIFVFICGLLFVDVIAYALLIHFLSVIDLSSIVIASLGARLISAIVNYYINRELVLVNGQRTVCCSIFISDRTDFAVLFPRLPDLFDPADRGFCVVKNRRRLPALFFSYHVQKCHL